MPLIGHVSATDSFVTLEMFISRKGRSEAETKNRSCLDLVDAVKNWEEQEDSPADLLTMILCRWLELDNALILLF